MSIFQAKPIMNEFKHLKWGFEDHRKFNIGKNKCLEAKEINLDRNISSLLYLFYEGEYLKDVIK